MRHLSRVGWARLRRRTTLDNDQSRRGNTDPAPTWVTVGACATEQPPAAGTSELPSDAPLEGAGEVGGDSAGEGSAGVGSAVTGGLVDGGSLAGGVLGGGVGAFGGGGGVPGSVEPSGGGGGGSTGAGSSGDEIGSQTTPSPA